MISATHHLSGSRLALVLLVSTLCLLVVLPFVLVRFPPLNDYPFHLARVVILAQIHDPQIAHFYSRGSFLLPNVAMDVFTIPLAAILGAEAAVRLFVEFTLIVVLVGAILLHRVAHGVQSPWPLLCVVLLHNGIFRFGFLNYLFGVGLALAASAVWLALPRRLPRLVFQLGASLVLLLCHLEAFGVFAIIVGGCELQTVILDWNNRPFLLHIRNLLTSALPFLFSIALFVLLSPTAGMAGHTMRWEFGLAAKAIAGLFSLSSGIIWLDLVTAGALAGLSVWLAWTRRLVVSPALGAAALLLFLAYMIVPERAMGALYIDVRLGPALAIVALLSLDLRSDVPHYIKRAVFVLALVLAGLRCAALSAQWTSYDRQTAAIVASFDRIQSGATLFAATSQPYTRLVADTSEKRAVWQPPLKHVASYAALHGAIFVPATWSDPTQQPLVVKPAFVDVKQFQGSSPFILSDGKAFDAFLNSLDNRLSDGRWPDLGSVYLLVVEPKALAPMHLPASFRIAAQGERFVLLESTRSAKVH